VLCSSERGGGCAWKIVKLTSGGLCCLVRIEMRIGVVFESRLAYELEVRRSQGLLRVERKEERGKRKEEKVTLDLRLDSPTSHAMLLQIAHRNFHSGCS